jgi:cytochrome c
MKVITAVFAAASLLASSSLLADDVFAKNKCNTCHDASAKKIGPTWKDVAAKNKDVHAAVKAAVTDGSKDKYGKIPMPKQPNAVADIDALAKAIAAVK